MIKTYIYTLLSVVLCAIGAKAQVTTSPTPLQEDSQDVTIFFHADQGNKGLMGLGPETKIYAHTGVILEGQSEWKYAPTWGDNSDKYQLTYVSPNLWQLYIGDIRTYYGIKNPSETVAKLAFVFRTADKSKEGKGEGNTDIFVDVVDRGLQISLESDLFGNIVTSSTANVTFNVSTTEPADITLTVNDMTIGSASNTKLLTVPYTFNGIGDYTVTATATAKGESVSVSKDYCWAEDSQMMAYPGGTPIMGPVKNADGSVTFCLGAPQKQSVILVGEWDDYAISNDNVMYYTDIDGLRYFWVTVNGLDNDTMYGYYFLVDGTIKVGDPYARLVLDPWNDKYLNTDAFTGLPEYPFDKIQNTPLSIYQGSINDYDWQVDSFVGVPSSDLIIYELLFRDFTGTEGKADGNGTVKGAIEKLPYLKSLGVNAIEVLPIMEFSGNISWGYNPNFYFAVDKAYGTPDDYKEFIDLCHQNGIAVILDMVFNQSDGLHPWYNMYPPSANPFYNLDAPHAYSVLNDWNQGFPMVQQQWADVIRYWMTEYKFDGFRFDLVKGLGLNESYANNGMSATDAYNESRVKEMRYLQEIVESVNPNAYFINENLAGAKEENEMAATGQLNWANLNDAGCQFAMGYSDRSNLNPMYAPKNDNRLWGSTVSYLESHDEQRLAYKQDQYGASGVKGMVKPSMWRLGSAAAQMILAPGAHMIWQFSEMGNAQNTKTDMGNNVDPKIVNWNLLNEPNHYGLYQNYCELIAIRNQNPELFTEEASFSSACAVSNWANGRTLISKAGDKELFTVVNPNIFGAITVNVNFNSKNNGDYAIISKSYTSEPSFNAAEGTITVPANCYVCVASNQVADVEGITVDKTSQTLRAYGANGTIVVDYAPIGATVYSLDGKVVGQTSESGRVSVASGLYIVKSGKETLKIMVN